MRLSQQILHPVLNEVWRTFAHCTVPLLKSSPALNMLHVVAVQYAKKNNRPLVLIINNVQFFRNDDNGKNMILQFLQRAEEWGPSGKT